MAEPPSNAPPTCNGNCHCSATNSRDDGFGYAVLVTFVAAMAILASVFGQYAWETHREMAREQRLRDIIRTEIYEGFREHRD